MRAHWLQHVPFEGLGCIEEWMVSKGIEPSCTKVYAGDPLPDPAEVKFLVIMGGPMSVNEETIYPWLVEEKQLIRSVMDREKPIFGICLGAQLIASALGARVYPARQKEIGWFPVRPSDKPTPNTLFPEEINVFHWHGETFDLPDGAERLASTDVCRNQAFRLGSNVLATQFHLEVRPEGAKALVQNSAGDLLSGGPTVQSTEEILSVPPGYYKEASARLEVLLDALL